MLKQMMLIICGVFLFTTFAFSQDEQKVKMPESNAWNKVCPVEGNQVNADIKTIKHNDKEYGFCSAACATVFTEEPAFHAANLNEDGTKYVGKKKKARELE